MAEYSGFAAVLNIYITSSFVAVAQVRDISGPSLSADDIDLSHRGSSVKTYKPGMLDGGEITLDIVYDPDSATHDDSARGGLPYALTGRYREQFRLDFADTTPAKATFYGYVTGFQPKTPMNDAQTADVTIKVDGAVAWS